MMQTILYIAAGGAVGSVLRYLCGLAVLRFYGGAFPLGVIFVNIVGSFIIGFLAVYLAQKSMMHWQPFLIIGLLGGFTTFSAFSLEALLLIERGQIMQAGLYIAASAILSILAALIGMGIARGIWA